MTKELYLTYTGPTDVVATDKEQKPVLLSLSCPNGLPVATEVRVTITGFRAFTDGGWRIERIDVKNGGGKVILGHGLPLHFRELVWPGISPAGGQLVGGNHRRINLFTVVVTRALDAGAQLDCCFSVRGNRHARIFPILELMVRLQGEPTFTVIGEPITIRNHPGDPERLELRLKASPDGTGKFHGVLFATDALANPSPSYDGTVTFSEPLAMHPETPGRYRVEGESSNRDTPIRIQVRDTRRGLEATSAPVLLNPFAAGQHYFGAIHFHTDLSVDGDGRMEDAYAYARDTLNLDVVAVTDHAPLGYQWEEMLRINKAFYEPGRFVTIPAWESSTAYGHANVYLQSPDTDATPGLWDPARNPSEMDWPSDAIVVPHHTGAGEKPFSREAYQQAQSDGLYWTKYDWSIPNPRVRLAEVVQGRGNFEADGPDTYWDTRAYNPGASLQDAFRMGWRLGFVAGTDNHQGYPTQMNGKYIGMTCFLAPALTREAIWDAMNRRRVYATSGVAIVCDFSVNGVPLGGEGSLREDGTVAFSATLHGTAPIERVDIVSNGAVVWSAEPGTWDVDLHEVALPAVEGASAYYYLRMRQADGHRAWLSPVWLDVSATA